MVETISSTQTPTERPPRRHFGLFCLQATGHLYPMGAVGRALQRRGHRVTCFQDVKARALVKAAGIDWQPLGEPAPTVSALAARRLRTERRTQDLMFEHARVVVAEGAAAVERTGVDALIVDQCDLAAGSVAERYRLPFITLSFFPPIYLDSEVPPHIVGWGEGYGPFARVRNWAANQFLAWALAPTVALVNRARRTWGLRAIRHLNQLFSERALIAQLPAVLDFPRRRKPSQLHYAGAFHDDHGRFAVNFPWEQLTGQPLIYASMGTVRNQSASVFEAIATACASLPVQLVLSLGGGLDPARIGSLPGRPIVAHFAPQLELLRHAAVTITHGGLNTTLESLFNGVPLVAIPVTDDQPGVGARIRRAGVGVVVPARTLTTERLAQAVGEVLENPIYRAAAMDIRHEIGALKGAEVAADIIEKACE